MEDLSISVEVPLLTPEEKMNMGLDEIIKHEKMAAGVSHNLSFRNFNKGSKRRYNNRNTRNSYRRPFFYRKRFRSQNWRLRNNGPNAPLRRQRVLAFLERKWRSTPLHSVFQRLGWRPNHEAAKAKLFFARHFRRSTTHLPFVKKWNIPVEHDPHRAQKLIASAKHYNSCAGLSAEDLALIDPNQSSQSLNKVNLQKLSQALGGTITSVKEEESDAGTVVTTITRVANAVNYNDLNSESGFNSMSRFHSRNSFGPVNSFVPVNNYHAMNGMPSAWGSSAFGNNANQMAFHRMNNGYNHLASYPSSNQSLISQPNSAQRYNQQGMHLNSIHNASNNVGGNSQNSLPTLLFKNNQTTPLGTNSALQKEISLLQNENRSRDTPPPLIGGSSGAESVQNGLHQKLAIHATNVSCSSRFGTINPHKEGDESMDF